MKLIPKEGLTAERLAEAAASEFYQVVALVREALEAKLATGGMTWVNVRSVYPAHAIVGKGARFYSYPYSIGADNVVTVAEPTEVVEEFTPVGSSKLAEAAKNTSASASSTPTPTEATTSVGGAGEGSFVEAKDDEGLRWDVRVIRAGASVNGNYYSDAALKEAVAMFEGAKVYALSDAEHLALKPKSVKDVCGWLSKPRFVEGKSADTGEILAELHMVESAAIRPVLVDAWKRGKKDLMALSVDLKGRTRVREVGSRRLREAAAITKVISVDVVTEPSAGGAFVRLAEAVQETDPMRDRLIAKIKTAPKTLAKIADIQALTDEQLEQHYTEAVAELTDPEPAKKAEPVKADATPLDAVRLAEARMRARNVVTASVLPDFAKSKVHAQLDAIENFTEADAERLVKSERDYLAQIGRFAESGKVRMAEFDEGARVEDRRKKIDQMLDDFFQMKRGAHSFKEAYIEITGDRYVTGLVANCDRSRLRELDAEHRFAEALDTTTLGNVLGAALRRKMIQDYGAMVQWDTWRKIASSVPVMDFRTHEITRMGGYGNLPAVAQGAAYTALTSPTDEKATYAPSKRGGIETVTLEAIKNDDVRAIAEIPKRLALAAKRTLYEFVYDFIRTNPTLYDSLAFFHASHNNLQVTALDATSFAVQRLAMLKQAEAGSTKRLGIRPASLLVPVDLQETGYNLFQRQTNNDPTFVNAQVVEVIPVIYWTDTNDWALVASPNECPGIEIGFLDGQEEPDLFQQDMPQVGSLFSNDQITMKIRHIYGGQVHNFRCATKNVVP